MSFLHTSKLIYSTTGMPGKAGLTVYRNHKCLLHTFSGHQENAIGGTVVDAERPRATNISFLHTSKLTDGTTGMR